MVIKTRALLSEITGKNLLAGGEHKNPVTFLNSLLNGIADCVWPDIG